jgi:putative membrane protein
MRLLIHCLIVALALFVAAWALPGIAVYGNAWVAYGVMAAILALVNAVLRPVLKVLTCPLILLTMGLFLLVINGITLWVSARIAQGFGIGFQVRGFWDAFLGGLVVSVVSVVLSAILQPRRRPHENA